MPSAKSRKNEHISQIARDFKVLLKSTDYLLGGGVDISEKLEAQLSASGDAMLRVKI